MIRIDTTCSSLPSTSMSGGEDPLPPGARKACALAMLCPLVLCAAGWLCLAIPQDRFGAMGCALALACSLAWLPLACALLLSIGEPADGSDPTVPTRLP